MPAPLSVYELFRQIDFLINYEPGFKAELEAKVKQLWEKDKERQERYLKAGGKLFDPLVSTIEVTTTKSESTAEVKKE